MTTLANGLPNMLSHLETWPDVPTDSHNLSFHQLPGECGLYLEYIVR